MLVLAVALYGAYLVLPSGEARQHNVQLVVHQAVHKVDEADVDAWPRRLATFRAGDHLMPELPVVLHLRVVQRWGRYVERRRFDGPSQHLDLLENGHVLGLCHLPDFVLAVGDEFAQQKTCVRMNGRKFIIFG